MRVGSAAALAALAAVALLAAPSRAAAAGAGEDLLSLAADDPETRQLVEASRQRAEALQRAQAAALGEPSAAPAADGDGAGETRFLEAGERVAVHRADGSGGGDPLSQAAALAKDSVKAYEPGDALTSQDGAKKELDEFKSGLESDMKKAYESAGVKMEETQEHRSAMETAGASVKHGIEAQRKGGAGGQDQTEIARHHARAMEALQMLKQEGGASKEAISQLSDTLKSMDAAAAGAGSDAAATGPAGPRTKEGAATLALGRMEDMLSHLERTRGEIQQRLRQEGEQHRRLHEGRVSRSMATNLRRLVDREFARQAEGLEHKLERHMDAMFGQLEKKLVNTTKAQSKSLIKEHHDELVGEFHSYVDDKVGAPSSTGAGPAVAKEAEKPRAKITVRARLSGISLFQFSSQARSAFRQAVADEVGADADDVSVEGAEEGQVLLQLRAAGKVGIDFTLVVKADNETAGATASKLQEAASRGSLSQSLERAGVKATLQFLGKPKVEYVPSEEEDAPVAGTGATGATGGATGATGGDAGDASKSDAAAAELDEDGEGARFASEGAQLTSESAPGFDSTPTTADLQSAFSDADRKAEAGAGAAEQTRVQEAKEAGEAEDADTTGTVAEASEVDVNGQPAFKYGEMQPEGPSQWGTWYRTCGEGRQQSPIDLITEGTHEKRTVELKAEMPGLEAAYTPFGGNGDDAAVVVNNGHSVLVNYPRDAKAFPAFLRYGGATYRLKQFHFHAPSEHKVNGEEAAMEMQLVHELDTSESDSDDSDSGNSDAPQFLTVSLLYDQGTESEADPLLERVFSSLPPPPARDARMPAVSPLDGSTLSLAMGVYGDSNPSLTADQFWTYMGSLTTPPCAEGVRWIVLKERATASPSQVKALRNALPEGVNARPVQNDKWRGQLPIAFTVAGTDEEVRTDSMDASEQAMSLIRIA